MKTDITVLIHCLKIYYNSDTLSGLWNIFFNSVFPYTVGIFFSERSIGKQAAELYV
jgi:hypothetical protein